MFVAKGHRKVAQLCKACLAEVTLMKYQIPKPPTFQAAVELLRQRKLAEIGEEK